MQNNMIEENLLEELRAIRIQYSIKKEPCYSIKDCLSSYSKERLFDMAYNQGIQLGYPQKKTDIIKLLEGALVANISKDSLYMSDMEREALASIARGDKVDEICMDTSISLQSTGYVYLFYYNKSFYPVCPKEIAERFLAAYNDSDNEVVKRNNDIFRYTKALSEIYGVYEVDDLISIWNRYHSIELSKTELYEHMNVMCRLQLYYWWDEPYIVIEYFEDEDQYMDFLNEVSGIKRYIPSEDEINYYSEKEFDEESIYYKELLYYFVEKNELDEAQLDELMLTIQTSCTMDAPIKEILDEIAEAGCTLDDINDVNCLVKLIIELTNNTRKWILKGHKPVELREQDVPLGYKKFTNNIIQFPGGTKS